MRSLVQWGPDFNARKTIEKPVLPHQRPIENDQNYYYKTESEKSEKLTHVWRR